MKPQHAARNPALIAIVVTALIAAAVPLLGAAPSQEVPTNAPTPKPSPSASATPRPAQSYARYLAADLAFAAKPRTPSGTSRVSGQLRAAVEYKFFGRNFAELETHDWNFSQTSGAIATRGYERQSALNTSVVGAGHVYLATSSLLRTNASGAPRLASPFGFGLEALPAFERVASISGSVFYYPDVNGKLATAGGPLRVSYKLLTYQLNATLAPPGMPAFLEIGLLGDHYLPKANAANGTTHRAFHLGIGAHV